MEGQEASLEQLLWFPAIQKRPQAALRLFCLPYAGGSVSAFAGWQEIFPPKIDIWAVQLPGRWNRLRESPFYSFDELIAELGGVISRYLDLPIALFGHSMGSLIAFELARFLRRRGLPQPVHLFVSGRRAPQIPDMDIVVPDLPELEFVECLVRMMGTPKEVIEDPEMLQLVLPTLRADFAVCRSYRYVAQPPLACPITVFAGAQDQESYGGLLEAWQEQTVDACNVMRFPGGHFYLHCTQRLLSEAITESLGLQLQQR